MSEYYIYIHRQMDTGQIFYVGKGQNDRAYVKRRGNKLWNNIVKKHGFIVEIICYFDNESLAFMTEKYLIKSIGRRDLGLGPLANMTDGGEGHSGFKQSMKTRIKKSKATKGIKKGPFSKDHKDQLSISAKKRSNGNNWTGRNHTEKSKENNRKAKIKQLGLYEPSKKELKDLYLGENLAIRVIAKKLGRSADAISMLLDEFKIPKRIHKPNKNKGRTFEEIHGPERAIELKKSKAISSKKQMDDTYARLKETGVLNG